MRQDRSFHTTNKRTITLDTARTGAMAHTTTQVTSHNRRGGACTSLVCRVRLHDHDARVATMHGPRHTHERASPRHQTELCEDVCTRATQQSTNTQTQPATTPTTAPDRLPSEMPSPCHAGTTSPAAEIAATHDYTLEDSRAKHSNTSTRTCANPPHILRGGIAAQRRPRKARS
jgi:hypothetical protein